MSKRRRQSGAALAFSRREKQVLDAVYATAPATVNDVLARLPNPPGYSAVRAMLARLEEKGFVRHEEDGARYVYHPTRERAQTRASLLERIVDAYFDGSPTNLVATMLDRSAMSLSERELDELAALVDAARARTPK
ncbi:MAG: putative transcriptional regulator [Geminicoccaceae bacterium]|jgi:predicted transcriptional regulator|nr:putative transcriptional regulator [Geminicoccaceae bacterium]